MPQLGFQEMIVILVIALLVFGPKKLPELGKSLGKGIREFKKATNDLKANWEDQIREAQTAVEDVKQDVKQTIHEASKDPTESVAQTATASTVQTEHAKEAHNAPSN
jgi:TatA/E family protein of Tat protein translocase